MSKTTMVVLEIGDQGLAQIFSPESAISLSEALFDAAEKAEKEQRPISVVVAPKEKKEIVDRLPDEPLPEPEGVAERFSPAVQEALNFGEHSPVSEAPNAIIDLGNALHDIEMEIDTDSGVKVREAIRLLQQIVEGPCTSP